MLSLITQIEMKARDKNGRAIAVVCATQRQYPCTAGSGEEEVGTADMRSTPKTATGRRGISSPAESWPKLQFKILGNIKQCI